jgi:ammonium transporter, Amt family
MQAGFAMLCAGSVRQKNCKNIMLKNLLDASFGAIGFYTMGFAFAFGGTVGEKVTFIGNGNFGLKDVDGYAFFFFQYAFAASAATIVAGTVAERCKMSAYICYSFFLSAFVYPVVAHSIWDARGFLSPFRVDGNPFRGSGVVDFAGSGIVHFTGGVTALVAAIILGPRKGRFYDADGNPLEVPVTFEPHNVSLQILGTFLLWFGWYGFNPGSTLGLIVAGTPLAKASAHCAVTTTLGAASGAISGVFFDSIMDSMKNGEVSYDLTMAMNGCLAGLVGVTAGCATVEPWAAVLIGLVSGVVYWCASKTLIALRIDDAVDAIPVHCANGAWGIIAAGLFSKRELMTQAAYSTTSPQGWLMNWGEGSGDANLLLAQIVALLFIGTWVTVLMGPFFVALNMAGMFRVDELEEDVGLDISHHRGGAYDLAAPDKDHVEELMEIRASRHGKVEIPQEGVKNTEEY